jgi:hypothetical protein
MEHFYVTLPSNSSEQIYGKQPMCKFKTHLAKSLELDVEEWEVGLAEFIYPHTWHNIAKTKLMVKYLEKNVWVWVEEDIPSAYYRTPYDLIGVLNESVNKMLRNQKNNIHFVYNEHERKFLACVSKGYAVHFSAQLSIALGLGDGASTLAGQSETENTERHFFGEKIKAPFTVDLNRGLHTMFIYSDIVQHQLVGDVNVPLLRTIPVTGENGDVIVHAFDNIHYMGLARSTFQEIEVVITDDIGMKVPFEQGRVIVKLHFRKK